MSAGDPFDGLFDLGADKAEEMRKKAQEGYEIWLSEVRTIVDTHIKAWESMGYARAEALFFAGQLHHYLISLNSR